LGAIAQPVIWDQMDIDWTVYDAVLLRSTWDYHLKPERFGAWLDALDADQVTVLNSSSLIRWNTHKSYLRQLGGAGANVIETSWIPKGSPVDLRAHLESRGWTEAVVKPAISCTAYGTWRFDYSNVSAVEAEIANIPQCDLMIQPFLPAINKGELSFVFIAGQFSHAVLKCPASGDFRVQPEFNGTVSRISPSADLVRQAWDILGLAPQPTLYARIDGCIIQGKLMLMEMELIEPSLFLSLEEQSIPRLASASLLMLDARSGRR
jgi:glutathione synthase/RimK-type ligase-like ATP-grasp enzyme